MDLQQTRPILNGQPLAGFDPSGAEWVLEEFEGWEGAAGSTISIAQKPRGRGGWAGDAFERPRQMSIGGKVFAASYQAITDAETRLNSACTLQDALLVVDEGGLVRSCMVRRTDEPILRRLAPTVAIWSLQVVATDPAKFGAELSGSTALPSFSGGLTVPFTVPFTVDSVLVSGQVNLINPGNEVGPVRLRIDGPCHGPSISHAASGLALTFSSSLVLGAGEWLEVDMEARTVMANGQSSRSGYVTARGWSGFTPGLNSWSFTATSFDAGALLSVMATPAWK